MLSSASMRAPSAPRDRLVLALAGPPRRSLAPTSNRLEESCSFEQQHDLAEDLVHVQRQGVGRFVLVRLEPGVLVDAGALPPPLEPEPRAVDAEEVSFEVVAELAAGLDVLEALDAVVEQRRHAQRTRNRPKGFRHILFKPCSFDMCDLVALCRVCEQGNRGEDDLGQRA